MARPRPYPPHLSLAPSHLRPHCLASERLLRWQPATRPAFALESDDDRARVFAVMSRAWRDSTLQTYGSGLLIYHVFCDRRGLSERDRAPASRSTIAVFIADLAGLYSPSAISNYIAALSAWHILHRLEWCASEAEVDALIRGAAALAPPRGSPRPPFTVQLLHAVLQQLVQTDPLDCAVAAALTTAFWGTARLGELMPDALDKLGPQHPTPACVRQDADRSNNSVTVIRIPRTKCAPGGEDIYWASQPGLGDPAAALDRHIQLNKPGSHDHLFAYAHGSRLRPLTRHTFLKRLKAAGDAAGVHIPPAHSIRIGSTTEYLLRGMPFDVMRAKGRWKSDSFLLYLRKHAEIMAPYIQANPAVLGEFTRVAMPPVR